MAKKTIADVSNFRPMKKAMAKIDANFTEVYDSSDTANAAQIATNVTGISDNVTAIALNTAQTQGLTEYADNAAALTGGLSVGDFYQTTGTVMIVIAGE